MPKKIDFNSGAGTDFAEFTYGSDRSRLKQYNKTGSTYTTTYYIGGLYEKETVGAVTEHRHNIVANGKTVAVYTRPSSGSPTTQYVLRDHQSSVVAMIDDAGDMDQEFSFDAFGKRRNTNWTADTSDARFGDVHETERGYTGHEHLDNVRLIHMNGRVQDPIIGRMISADPFVPDPMNGQSFNRYSYVINNPLSRIDPTGFVDYRFWSDDGGDYVVYDGSGWTYGGLPDFWRESERLYGPDRPNFRGGIYGHLGGGSRTGPGRPHTTDPSDTWGQGSQTDKQLPMGQILKDNTTLEGRSGAFGGISGTVYKAIGGIFDIDLGSVHKDVISGRKRVSTGITIGGELFGFEFGVEIWKRDIPFEDFPPGCLYCEPADWWDPYGSPPWETGVNDGARRKGLGGSIGFGIGVDVGHDPLGDLNDVLIWGEHGLGPRGGGGGGSW